MAKKNAREEPPKPTVAENAQMSDIVFILDKMELLLKAVSEIRQDGKFKTVDADKRHRNSFLKIDRYADIFENFIKNFWSQFKVEKPRDFDPFGQTGLSPFGYNMIDPLKSWCWGSILFYPFKISRFS